VGDRDHLRDLARSLDVDRPEDLEVVIHVRRKVDDDDHLGTAHVLDVPDPVDVAAEEAPQRPYDVASGAVRDLDDRRHDLLAPRDALPFADRDDRERWPHRGADGSPEAREEEPMATDLLLLDDHVVEAEDLLEDAPGELHVALEEADLRPRDLLVDEDRHLELVGPDAEELSASIATFGSTTTFDSTSSRLAAMGLSWADESRGTIAADAAMARREATPRRRSFARASLQTLAIRMSESPARASSVSRRRSPAAPARHTASTRGTRPGSGAPSRALRSHSCVAVRGRTLIL
jgi:hypothetical protein